MSMTHPRILTGLIVAVAWLVTSAHAAEYRTTVTLQANGTAHIRADRTELRTTIEQQIKMWERYQNESPDADDVLQPPSQETVIPDPGKASNEVFLAGVRRMMAARMEQMGDEFAKSIELLTATSNEVHTVTKRTVASLEELLPQLPTVFGQSGLFLENIKMESLPDGQLVTTLVPSRQIQAYGRRMFQSWKMSGTAMRLQMEFPGNIVASSLPGSSARTATIQFVPSQPDAIETALALHQSSIIITTGSGGLKLAQPLESAKLRPGGAATARNDLPVTDAGPGFLAEATAVSTTVIHRFPDAPPPPSPGRSFAGNPPGTSIRAKLHAPRGRTIQSVTGARILKAADDRGRPISTDSSAGGVDPSAETRLAGSQGQSGVDITLRLPLPQPDALSIEELTAEAVITSTGKWKEIILTNITASATNAFDLAAALPETTMTLSRFVAKPRQASILAKITGPTEIRDLEIEFVLPSGKRANSNASERSSRSTDGRSTRSLQLQCNSYDDSEIVDRSGAVSLRVRYPEDQRRERFQFVLRGLDLL
jgi:hypothetical protein